MAKSIIKPGLRAAIRAESPEAFARTIANARNGTAKTWHTVEMRAWNTAYREFVEAEATRRIRFARETLETLGMAGRRAA